MTHLEEDIRILVNNCNLTRGKKEALHLWDLGIQNIQHKHGVSIHHIENALSHIEGAAYYYKGS